jgi:hypothetical protein
MSRSLARLTLTPLLVGALLASSGCANLNDVVQAKELRKEGTTRSYAVAPDRAYDIARTVFRWEGADAIEDHRDKYYLLTSSGANAYTQGTVMGAWIEPDGQGGSQVTVVTKRRIQTNLFTSLTESTFHRRFAQAVELTRQGKPLPDVAPS